MSDRPTRREKKAKKSSQKIEILVICSSLLGKLAQGGVKVGTDCLMMDATKEIRVM